MAPDHDSERYIADYGNLLLKVFRRDREQEHVFEYTVTDKTDGFVCWTGSTPSLATAQSDAMLEAQLFLDPYITSPTPPQWRRDSESARHV